MHLSGEGIKPGGIGPVRQSIKHLVLFLAFICFFPVKGKPGEILSPSTRISILTCGPGKPLYAAFGHTALYVNDPENGIDQVFNFGTFDVNTPNFYMKFLTGRLKYALSVSDFETFISEYRAENRWVYEQDLLISPVEKQALYDSLVLLMQPENRYYIYDFFKKNCSTRAIDIVLAFSAGEATVDSLKKPTGTTFRQALGTYIAGREWLQLGINMMLGPYADQKMSKLQSTYLPENLMHVVGLTPIAGAPETIIASGYQPPERKNPDLPTIIFWVFALMLVFEALWAKSSMAVTNRIDGVLFSIAGILGLFFIFLWIWSDHLSLHLNLNLFWANPLGLVLAWTITTGRKKTARVIAVMYGLMVFFLLINWSRLPQQIPLELMPLVTILAFRAINRIFNFKKQHRTIPSNPVSQ